VTVRTYGQIRREVALHAALSHPAILPLYIAFDEPSHVNLVMEYLEHGDLATCIFEKKVFKYNTVAPVGAGAGAGEEGAAVAGGGVVVPAEADVARKVLAPLLSALRYLHHNGVAHRDLKVCKGRASLLRKKCYCTLPFFFSPAAAGRCRRRPLISSSPPLFVFP
jgi:serine/threonine protein kinase